MANFNTPDGELSNLFMTSQEVLESFATNGRLWLWGTNDFGQLGDNSITSRGSPVQTVAGGNNWKKVIQGDRMTIAVKTDGTLWTWGRGSSGQLGDGTNISKSSPIQTIAGGDNWVDVGACSAGAYAAALKSDGTLWTWGVAGAHLGSAGNLVRSSPGQTIAAGTNWVSLNCGRNHMAAIKSDGTLWLWGANASGQLGTNNVTAQSSAVQTIAAGTNWKQVCCSDSFTAAVKTDGTLWVWGVNGSSQLGIGSTTTLSSPSQTAVAGSTWKQVATGNASMHGIKTDGTLWTWGRGSTTYQVANGGSVDVNTPVQSIVPGPWKTLFSGGGAGYGLGAIKTDGTLWTWGRGPSYLGAPQGSSGSPVQTFLGGNMWKQVSCGYAASAAITYLTV